MTKNHLPLLLALFTFTVTHHALADGCLDKWEKVIDQSTTQELKGMNEAYIGSCDQELKDQLSEKMQENHLALRYSDATKLMYKTLDVNDGMLCSVYNANQCNIIGEKKEFNINCEHSWPKSLGASGYPAVSDLHHLYPAQKDVNNQRANLPFCEVKTVIWTDGESKIGMANNSDTCFEPPLAHKGNLARSMFYFAVRYHHTIDADQEKFLRKWNSLDPVDQVEVNRNSEIEKVQGNRNPFVDLPLLVEMIENF